MIERVRQIFTDSIIVKEATLQQAGPAIVRAAEVIIQAFKTDHKVLIFGNGGSAADSQHIAAEFVSRFQKERQAWPAIALTTDSSILTSIGNDYTFDRVFARQIEALGRTGDVAFAITTSGNSPDVLEAAKTARTRGLTVIGVTGGTGGKLPPLCDILIKAASPKTARIQESHLVIYHAICELVEEALG